MSRGMQHIAIAKVGGSIISGKRLLDLRKRLKGATFLEADMAHGLTYQTCRFCRGGDYGSKGGGLYKYEVRHYICRECLSDADATLPRSA